MIFKRRDLSSILLYDKFISGEKDRFNALLRMRLTKPNENTPFVTAWDDKSFGVRSREYGHILENLYDAFQTNNGVIVSIKNCNPFSRGGLTLLDYRLIPEPSKDAFRELDRKHYEK